MKKRIFIGFFILVAFAGSIFSGCAGKYGKYVLESRYNSQNKYKDETRMTLQKLGDNYLDYDLFYSGLKPSKAGGILFVPKNSDKVVKTVNYRKIEDEKTLSDIVKWNTGIVSKGRLYQVLGYGDQLFAYIYHPNVDYKATAKIIDENTLELTAHWYTGEKEPQESK